jgi:tight adherence protein C
MMTVVLLSAAFGAGLWLTVTALPFARRRPSLALRLHAMTAQGRTELESAAHGRRPSAYKSPILGQLLGPFLEDLGGQVGRILARFGVASGNVEDRLTVAWPGMTAPQFYGQKLASGLLFLALFPFMNVSGIHPFGPWPVWSWLGGFALGFAMPDWLLQGRIERRRTTVLMELPTALDLLAIAASTGMSPEQAIVEASRQMGGVLGEGLCSVVREAGLGTATHAEGLRALAEREGVPELVSVADAWQSALEQGLPLGQAMLSLAETVRDKKRARLLAEGGKSTVRMLFPVAVFIFPVFLVILLYPAGSELLGLGR